MLFLIGERCSYAPPAGSPPRRGHCVIAVRRTACRHSSGRKGARLSIQLPDHPLAKQAHDRVFVEKGLPVLKAPGALGTHRFVQARLLHGDDILHLFFRGRRAPSCAFDFLGVVVFARVRQGFDRVAVFIEEGDVPSSFKRAVKVRCRNPASSPAHRRNRRWGWCGRPVHRGSIAFRSASSLTHSSASC